MRILKFSHSYTQLNEDSIKEGKLKIGDYVTPTTTIVSPEETLAVYPGEFYRVVEFLPSKYKGGFVIDVEGNKWGFWFSKEGLGKYFQKVEMSKQDKMEVTYGELPYKILQTLDEKGLLSLDNIVEIVLNQKLSVPPENVRKVKTEIIKAVYALQELQFIAPTVVVKDGQKTYMITPKGKQYLKAD
jgi:hypothetical protein